MTATATPRPTASATGTPSSRHRPVPPVRRRTVAVVVLLALLAVLVASRAGGGHVMAPTEPLAADVQGTYRLSSGGHLTLWGDAAHPSYEAGGAAGVLSADGDGSYVFPDGSQTLTVVRDDTGDVAGMRVTAAGGSDAFAARESLHSEEEVTFSSSGGVQLAGTLLVPAGDGPHPAVVIVHGAERRDRETYRLLASHLARRGVAALMYDKRGTGASTGTVADASFDDLTDDALAGVDLLSRHPQIDPSRIGTLGFSQGAWVVAQAGRRSEDVAFVIAYSPSGVSPAAQAAWLHGSMLAARGFDQTGMHIADRVDRMLYSSLDLVDAGTMPPIPQVPGFWFHALDLHLDSASLWEGVRQPVLAAWGELDCQVPAIDSRDAMAAALERGGNSDVTLRVLPGADHSFMLADPCDHELGFGHHGTVAYADGYFDLAPDWIDGLPAVSGSDVVTSAEPTEGGVLGWHLDPPLPAPWYGSIAVQLVAVATLLVTFLLVAGRWVVRPRGRAGGRSALGHLAGASGVLGFAATAAGFAAITEVAMLADVHAALLVGGPTVSGASSLMRATPLLVLCASATGLAALAVASRRGPGMDDRARVWARVGASAAAGLILWSGYWGLIPLP